MGTEPSHAWRPDGVAKVTGQLRYLTDLRFPGMLVGKVLRSAHPHARILRIDTSQAEQLPGVHAVLTHRDVPGMNRFGIVLPDQPVFCEDRVRFVGDALCAVAADSADIAEAALRLVHVVYDPLPVVADPLAALAPDAPRLHPGGNLLHRVSHRTGETEAAFARCAAIVEETYDTPRQMHTYLETEGGVAVPDGDGGITVYMATQHGYRDRSQLARILALPEDRIRVVSSPIGGSFGGKDELNVQPYAALLALATGRPVQVHQTRTESVISGLKRHPMRIWMKTGTDADGHLLAHQVRIVADTGAYATLGPAVLDFAVEHAVGPYRIPCVDIDGQSVYTNNGVSGEFRGFGGNQVTFALEGQMDRLAERLGLDPWELRRRNLRRADDLGPLGQRVVPTDGALQVLEAVRQSRLWPGGRGAPAHAGSAGHCGRVQEPEAAGTDASVGGDARPWERLGTGMALCMHGCGLGFGRPDPAGGRLALTPDGKLELAFGLEEIGQGLLAVIARAAGDAIGCAPEDLRLTVGDTAAVPASGSTTASRATHVVYHAVRRLAAAWKPKVLAEAAEVLGVRLDDLRLGPGGVWWQAGPARDGAAVQTAEGLSSARAGGAGPCLTWRALAAALAPNLPTAEVAFHFPVTPDAVPGAHTLYTFAGVVVRVAVDLCTGRVRVLGVDQAVAAGPVVYPLGYAGQIEGGNAMGIGFALLENAAMADGRYQVANLDRYLVPTIADVPAHVGVNALEELPPGDMFGPRGVGEIGTVAVAPAIAAAVHDAVGHFVRGLPISPEEILAATTERAQPGSR
ncbi:MAG: xanthine dehydrogenase subunit D [Alicyclobacillus sp.]|nr:xanthine dehydrogenase subunit D [Alicyclobacillus sp.]